MRPYVAELSRVADIYVSAYPNAGLPNAMGEYDQAAEEMADQIEPWARDGYLNLVGGCCGSTPAHIKALHDRMSGHKPRPIPRIERKMRLSGLEPFVHA